MSFPRPFFLLFLVVFLGRGAESAESADSDWRNSDDEAGVASWESSDDGVASSVDSDSGHHVCRTFIKFTHNPGAFNPSTIMSQADVHTTQLSITHTAALPHTNTAHSGLLSHDTCPRNVRG